MHTANIEDAERHAGMLQHAHQPHHLASTSGGNAGGNAGGSQGGQAAQGPGSGPSLLQLLNEEGVREQLVGQLRQEVGSGACGQEPAPEGRVPTGPAETGQWQ